MRRPIRNNIVEGTTVAGVGCFFMVINIVAGLASIALALWLLSLLYTHVIVPTFHTPPLRIFVTAKDDK